MTQTTVNTVNVQDITSILAKEFGNEGGLESYNASVADKIVTALDQGDPEIWARVEDIVYASYLDAVVARQVAARVTYLIEGRELRS